MKKILFIMISLLLTLGLFGCSKIVNEKSLVAITDTADHSTLSSQYNDFLKKNTIINTEVDGFKGEVKVNLLANSKSFKGNASLKLDFKANLRQFVSSNITANGKLELMDKPLNFSLKLNTLSSNDTSYNSINYEIKAGNLNFNQTAKFKDKDINISPLGLKKIGRNLPLDFDILVDELKYLDIYSHKSNKNNVYFKIKLDKYLNAVIHESSDSLKRIGFSETPTIQLSDDDFAIIHFYRNENYLIFKGLQYQINMQVKSGEDLIKLNVNALIKEESVEVKLPTITEQQQGYNDKKPTDVLDKILGALIIG